MINSERITKWSGSFWSFGNQYYRECTRSKQIVKEKFIMLGLINILKKIEKHKSFMNIFHKESKEKNFTLYQNLKYIRSFCLVLFNGRSTLLQSKKKKEKIQKKRGNIKFLIFLVYRYYVHCTENHILFFQMSWKDGLSKKIALEYDLSCIIGRYGISFSRKHDLAAWTENERWSFSKKYTEI